MRSIGQRVLGGEGSELSHEAAVQIAGIILVTPAVFLSCLLLMAPFVTAVWWSVTDKSTLAPTLSNYQWLLVGPGIGAWLNSFYIGVGSVALEVLVAIPMALLLNQALPARGFMRAAVTLPWAIPTVAVAAAFLWLSNTTYGLFNQVGLATGILRTPISLLGSVHLALPVVTVAAAWKGLPLVFVVILSSLQSMPSEYLEAAKVDGAWRIAQLRHIILPHLKTSVALAAVLSGIYNFSLFDIVFLLTGGGPAGVTTNLPILLYMQQFRALDPHRAAVAGVTIFLSGTMALVAIQLMFGVAERKSGR